MPVDSEAYAATRFTAQFCTGGKYNSIAVRRSNNKGIKTATPAKMPYFFFVDMDFSF